jgi:3-oxoadipate enol-lactonase/4-carboxymuconolactone decarboxylase
MKPPLVLIGSLGTPASVWDRQMPTLTPWFDVVRIELPGHGEAPALTGPYTVEGLGEQVLATMDARRAAKASVAGLDLGGLVAIWLAAKRPDRVDRLAVCCAAPRFGTAESWNERAATVRAHGTGKLAAGSLECWFTEPFRSRPAAQQLAAALSAVDDEAYALCCEFAAVTDLHDQLKSITAPTHVIAGSDDPSAPPEGATSTMRSVRGAGLTVIPQAAHLANVERPDMFNAALLGHLVGDAAERGMAARRRVLGDAHVDAALSNASPFSAPWQDFLTRWPWGELWSRPGLDETTRRMLTIAMLVALDRPDELEMHIRAAVRAGLEADVLHEVLLQTAVYAGVPAANSAFRIAERALSDLRQPGRT